MTISVGANPQQVRAWASQKASNTVPAPSMPAVTMLAGGAVSSTPLFARGGSGAWDYAQVEYFNPMPHPTDPSKIRVYYNAFPGQGATYGGGNGYIDVPIASFGSPPWDVAWKGATNPIIGGSARSQDYELDSMLDVGVLGSGGTRYAYCSNITNNNVDLYSSTDGTTFTLAQAGVLAPGGSSPFNAETIVSQMAVANDAGTYRAYYCYRTAGAPLPGISYATASSPAGPFTKIAKDVVAVTGSTYWEQYIEGTQILLPSQVDGTHYALIFSCYDMARWTSCGFASSAPGSGWVPFSKNALLDLSRQGVYNATPCVYSLSGTTYLLFQYSQFGTIGWNSAGAYTNLLWDAGMAVLPAGISVFL